MNSDDFTVTQLGSCPAKADLQLGTTQSQELHHRLHSAVGCAGGARQGGSWGHPWNSTSHKGFCSGSVSVVFNPCDLDKDGIDRRIYYDAVQLKNMHTCFSFF